MGRLAFVNEGAQILARQKFHEVARLVHVEDNDRQLVVLAKGGGSEVHHLELAVVDLVVGDLVELRGSIYLIKQMKKY